MWMLPVVKLISAQPVDQLGRVHRARVEISWSLTLAYPVAKSNRTYPRRRTNTPSKGYQALFSRFVPSELKIKLAKIGRGDEAKGSPCLLLPAVS